MGWGNHGEEQEWVVEQVSVMTELDAGYFYAPYIPVTTKITKITIIDGNVGRMTNEVKNIHYVDFMPERVDLIGEGYLLYDVETELFAGPSTGWNERVAEIFLDDDLTWGERGPEFRAVHTNKIIQLGSDIVLVPCMSYEFLIQKDTVHIYREYNWRQSIVIKSRSGGLYGGTWVPL